MKKKKKERVVGEGPVRWVVFSKKERGIDVMGIFVFSKFIYLCSILMFL